MKPVFDPGLLEMATFKLNDLDGKKVALRFIESEGLELLYACEGDQLYLIQHNLPE
ncbi:hypothetical protein [Gordoniibacillus kamchatkensis]|uniref:hypothetical protein n=1 Tax=Gordoniibacillus kamchatkensis TaxID=1590651 RepID=UPI0012DFEFBA|nr:hypothetical protein [Paenibacillus sp. VKM B-2647]